jgi:hypothetical protein
MTTNKEIFSKHVPLGTFVETGTCFGRSVEIALVLGFKEVRSVEGDIERFKHCQEKFKHYPQVKLWCGESIDLLPVMIHDLKTPALFWLDAHASGPEGYGLDHETNPWHEQSYILRTELKAIKERGMLGDVILVDDLTPDVESFARELFKHAAIWVHDTDEGPHKVMEVVT